MGTSLLTGPTADRSGAAGPPRGTRSTERSRVTAVLDAVTARPRLDPVVLALGIGAVCVLVKAVWPRFTWFGDNSESFFPLWHLVGSALRDGQWLGFDPTGFSGANTVGEAAYGMFNPVTLLNAVLISGFDELARAAFVVMTEFLVLLGLGVRALALAHGARRSAAFTVGVIAPFAGFTLYWGAGNWASGLMAITWVTWTWWAVRRYRTGERGPLPIFLLGALAITVGSPYSLLAILIVLAGTAVELLVARRPHRLAGLVVAGLCLGGVALLTYLPLLGALPVTIREVPVPVVNTGNLAPSLGDLVGLSSPTLLPEINAWKSNADKVPSVYLSWIVLPLLPWLRWSAWGTWRDRLGLVVPTAVFLLLTLGPDRIWLFRWPLRLIEYSWVGLLVCLALVLSAGLARTRLRQRAIASASIVAGGFFLAWSSTPVEVVEHVAATAVVAALVAATLLATHRFGLRALAVLVLVGTVVVTPAQAALHGWDDKPVAPDLDIGRASDLADVREATEAYRGTVFQVSSPFSVTDPAAVMSGRLAFGHMLAAAGHPTLNRYTGIEHRAFLGNLSLDYRGAVAYGDPLGLLFGDLPGYDTPVVDALGIDTLVVGRHEGYPTDGMPRPGWRVVVRDAYRTVYQRDEVPSPGPQVTTGPGIEVLAAEDSGTGIATTTTLAVEAPRGGTVVLDRLAWPGYRAQTTDGEAVPVSIGPFGLVELVLPPGTTTLELTYEVPGLRTGLTALALAGALALGHQAGWLRARRRPVGGTG